MKRCRGCDAIGHLSSSCPNPVLQKAKQQKKPSGGKGNKSAKAKSGKAPTLKGPQQPPRVSHIETPAREYHSDAPSREETSEPVVTQPDF